MLLQSHLLRMVGVNEIPGVTLGLLSMSLQGQILQALLITASIFVLWIFVNLYISFIGWLLFEPHRWDRKASKNTVSDYMKI